MKVSVIIPAYNEEGCIVDFTNRLVAVCDRTFGFDYEILFMVGGTDRTKPILEGFLAGISTPYDTGRFRVIYEKERGLGRALNMGFQFTDGDWALTMDSDLQLSPEDIPRLWSFCKPAVDIVIGAKRKDADARGFFKRAISKLVNGITSRRHGLPVRDLGTNFRFYRRTVIDRLDLANAPTNYAFMPWALIQAHKWGFEMVEVPVRFEPRRTGESKLSYRRELWERLRF